MYKKINFIPRDKKVYNVLDCPKSSKLYIPDWYKKSKNTWIDNTSAGIERPGMKGCLPFLDAFTSGYIHELPCDIEFVKNKNGDLSYAWHGEHISGIRPLITRQQESGGAPQTLPEFEGYYNIEFQWYTMWDAKTPKGYSTFYQHPINRFDLPFITMSGVIDTDRWNGDGPVPFLLKKDFEGTIPAGTPIIQFFPFKRENWKSEKNEYDEEKQTREMYKLKRYARNGYKKIAWSKKEYL